MRTKRFSRSFFTIALILLVFCLLPGCSGGGSNTGRGPAPVTQVKQPVMLTEGTETIVQSAVVGPTGGTVEAGSSGTPIDGVSVYFPAGALSEGTTVSLGYNNAELSPNAGTYGGLALVLKTGSITQFDQPVTITVPFTDISKVPVPYYVDATGKLHPVQLIAIDRSAKVFVFQTFHASLFTWIFGETAYAPGPQDIVNTGYVPSEDGFQVRNNGSDYNRDGECFGMTAFSLWYFENRRATAGDFYAKYMNVVGTDSSGNSLTGQDIIATRAYISVDQKWNTYYSNIVRDQSALSEEDRYESIRNVIMNTGNPVLIYLWHTDGSSGAHSVLAFAFNHLDGNIAIYDPIFPGQSKTIAFDSSTKKFSPYAGFDGIAYSGDGSLNLAEPYQAILDDANANFQGSGNATITVTSHVDGQQVSERNISLAGTIESGQVLVTRLKVLVGPQQFSTNVGSDGSFSLTVSLETGINHLQFVTEGKDAHGNLLTLPNNMLTRDFTVNLNVSTAAILVTLTWDTNDSDVDLYVIDPAGDYSSYYHLATADGGQLDHDITTGYGPEHWTLLTTNTVRYNQPYKVRLHYYSDHGHGPTNYTVSIKLYEGTDREQERWYRGNLAVSNPDNYQPNATGSDWVDITDIVLSEIASANATSQGVQAVSRTMRTGEANNQTIRINVPVPTPEQVVKDR